MVLPSRERVISIIEDVRALFFPGYFGTPDLQDESLHYFVGSTLARVLRLLEDQVREGVDAVAGIAVIAAATVYVRFAPTVTHWLNGCVVMAGGTLTTSTAGSLTATPAALLATSV